jgi:hypothetical protein
MDRDVAEVFDLLRRMRTLGKMYAQKRDANVMLQIQNLENQIDVRLEKIPVSVPETKTKTSPTLQGQIL